MIAKMKIAVFGAGGMIGQRIVNEALARGHEVTAVVRDPAKFTPVSADVKVVKGDVLDSDSVAAAVAGQDVVVSSVGPAHDGSSTPRLLVNSAHTLIVGLKQAGVSRLLIVGGAGSLEVAPGLKLFDTPDFPEAWRPMAKEHGEGLEVYRASTDLDWTFISPAIMIAPGERTGNYQQGFDQLLMDAQGESKISCEDYAVALLDEVEQGQFKRRRITVTN
ncbi:MAG: NAD(P)-dependent oxidoreductase [Anaerolineae bacterium]|nr:NAD(P)-dependent oxidoreductase [Anaerolineae bacterium]